MANLKATDWAINGVGRNFSHAFGYGIMDATCMVRLAKVWKSVGEKKMCSKASQDSNTIIPGKWKTGKTMEYLLGKREVAGNSNLSFTLCVQRPVFRVTMVVLH